MHCVFNKKLIFEWNFIYRGYEKENQNTSEMIGQKLDKQTVFLDYGWCNGPCCC